MNRLQKVRSILLNKILNKADLSHIIEAGTKGYLPAIEHDYKVNAELEATVMHWLNNYAKKSACNLGNREKYIIDNFEKIFLTGTKQITGRPNSPVWKVQSDRNTFTFYLENGHAMIIG